MSAKFQGIYDKLVAALPEKLSVPVAKKRKILVLTYRTIGYYHTPGAAGCLIFLREAARKYGAFEITEVYKPDGIDAKMLTGFDVVVLDNIVFPYRLGKYGPQFGLYNTNPELRAEIDSRSKKEADIYNPLYNELLPAYVKNGGGFVGVHATAVIPIFSHQDMDKMEFAAMLGGAVDPQCHPWKNGKLSGPGGYSPIPVKILEPNNPLTFAFRDAPNAGLTTELYSLWLPKTSMDTSRTLIRYDYDKMPGVTFNPKSMERCKEFAPSITWIKSYGKGRVYYSAIGPL